MEHKVYIEDVCLANQSNCKKVSAYLKYNWLRNLLNNCGLNLDQCYPEDSDEPHDQTPNQRNKLRMLLKENNIFVSDSFDDEVQVFIENELIAHWVKPIYDLRQDLTKINIKEKIYVGIKVKHWSVFD